MANVTERLIEALDQIEKRVELLRQEACGLEKEKSCLLELLETIHSNKDLKLVGESEREEIQVISERLMNRCLTVEVQVLTPRNPRQVEALTRVEKYIDEMVCKVRNDVSASKNFCESFLNACLPDPVGSVNFKFQSAIIECAADDQKRIRKRLESLLRTIQHTETMD
ncbi:hypothetical protein CHUAL_013101 [Chamberlinius hualienensis]